MLILSMSILLPTETTVLHNIEKYMGSVVLQDSEPFLLVLGGNELSHVLAQHGSVAVKFRSKQDLQTVRKKKATKQIKIRRLAV